MKWGKKSYFVVVIAVVIVITLKYTTRTSTNTCPSKIHTQQQQQQPERHMTIQTSYTQQNIRCERGGGDTLRPVKRVLSNICKCVPRSFNTLHILLFQQGINSLLDIRDLRRKPSRYMRDNLLDQSLVFHRLTCFHYPSKFNQHLEFCSPYRTERSQGKCTYRTIVA